MGVRSEEDLLDGVTAIDSEEGDVSDSLLIERVVSDAENGTATVIYVAKDSANNIVKVTRLLDAEKSGEETQTEEETDTETETDAAKTETDAAKESADTAGRRQETETERETETEETLVAGAPFITLTEEKVTITKGSTFEPLDYVATITDDSDNKYTLWRRVQIDGEYDTDTVGVYQLIYYVVDTSRNTSNHEKLQLTVKE
ncbi:MAG: DUF5011 domain-containing protein [Clostridiales bacterium]|nr:DUF5011 domain-containing protein [Clostridiales bacterium]